MAFIEQNKNDNNDDLCKFHGDQQENDNNDNLCKIHGENLQKECFIVFPLPYGGLHWITDLTSKHTLAFKWIDFPRTSQLHTGIETVSELRFSPNTLHFETLRLLKRGYFRWGEISRKCWQDISLEGNFHDTTPIFFIKAYWFYFRVG